MMGRFVKAHNTKTKIMRMWIQCAQCVHRSCMGARSFYLVSHIHCMRTRRCQKEHASRAAYNLTRVLRHAHTICTLCIGQEAKSETNFEAVCVCVCVCVRACVPKGEVTFFLIIRWSESCSECSRVLPFFFLSIMQGLLGWYILYEYFLNIFKHLFEYQFLMNFLNLFFESTVKYKTPQSGPMISLSCTWENIWSYIHIKITWENIWSFKISHGNISFYRSAFFCFNTLRMHILLLHIYFIVVFLFGVYLPNANHFEKNTSTSEHFLSGSGRIFCKLPLIWILSRPILRIFK